MGYIRFRRNKVWGRYNTKYFWKLDIARAKEVFPNQPLPAVIKERGVKLEDPNHPDLPRKTSLDPIEINHPAWPKSPPFQTHPWYRTTPGFVFTGANQLAEGTNHASAISKAVSRKGLPDSILKTADWLNLTASKERLEQLIMHSQRWDSTIEKLPKRRDPTVWWITFPRYFGIPQERKNELLLDNLYRFTQMEGVRNGLSDLKLRRHVRMAPINSVFDRLGNTICVNVTPNMIVSQPEFLLPVADTSAVEETSKESLFDIRPVVVTIDLQQQNIFNPGLQIPFSWSSTKQIIHTVFVNKIFDIFYPWSAHELTGHAVMHAFAAALSSARLMYPEAKGRLPNPVLAQCVQCCGNTFEFIVFQLNTVDFNDDSGVKNIVYVDGDNKLFTPIEHWKPYEKIIDYNPEVIRKYVALLSNGAIIKKSHS